MESGARKQSTRRSRRRLYEEAVAVIEAEYERPLTLEQVARRIATSPRQLQRAFAEAGDSSFVRCLTRVRMERAAQLLRQDSLSVGEVAWAVGYERHSSFTKAFRRHHGVSPSALRNARSRASSR